jgi:hypothetical protein
VPIGHFYVSILGPIVDFVFLALQSGGLWFGCSVGLHMLWFVVALACPHQRNGSSLAQVNVPNSNRPWWQHTEPPLQMFAT